MLVFFFTHTPNTAIYTLSLHDALPILHFLTRPEVKALLAAPDQRSWFGRRDHVFLRVAAQTGLRLSEMTGLTRRDVTLGIGAHVRVIGKGRKERCVPLAKPTVATLKAWLREPPRGDAQ